MSPPTVSAIMPCRDMGRFVPDAVGSILRQTLPVQQILLIDDGSTDDTAEVARGLIGSGAPIELLRAEGVGPARARNLGLAEARGQLIAFLDADDLWPGDKLERQAGRLAEQPDLGMVSGFVTYFEDLDAQTLEPAAGARTETVFHVHLGACLYRRQVFDAIGPFDPDFLFAEDVDLLMRVRDAGIPFAILRRRMLYYRRHPASMMMGPNPRRRADFNLAMIKSIRRRRAAGLGPISHDALEAHLDPEETPG